MTADDRLHVVIDARLTPGTKGGVESVVRGLLSGFNALQDDRLALTTVILEGDKSWLGAPGIVDVVTQPISRSGRIQRGVAKRPGMSQALAAAWTLARPPSRSRTERIFSDLAADVVHFPLQRGGSSQLPVVYQPHDLQHRHLPHMFTRSERLRRDHLYRRMCTTADMVVVGTSWVKDDVIRQFGVPSNRVTVIPLGAPQLTENSRTTASVPPRFAFYPAANWRHKDHATLFAAMRLLRDQGTPVHLVLSGPRIPQGVDLLEASQECGVSDLVEDVGYVPAEDVATLTKEATVLVVPTLFESASFPIWEAMSAGTPVVCSDVTALPRQVGGAGVVVEAGNPSALAAGIDRIWNDPGLASSLTEAGRARVAEFTWSRTAAMFAAVYRQVAGRLPTDSDIVALGAEPPL